MADVIPADAERQLPNPLLLDILRTGQSIDQKGQSISIGSNIPLSFAAALYRTTKAQRPKAVIEIGMAHGISSMAILTALKELGEGGRLISIDPNQSSEWAGVGMASVQRMGMAAQHTLVEEFDYLALPRLLAGGERFQMGYIDGYHTFDYTLLDFFYLDKMLDVGGVVGFNDCGYRAVNRALGFVVTHRHYSEINVGLPPNYTGRNIAYSLARRVLGHSTTDRYFRKDDQYEPAWNFYRRF